MSVVGRRFRSIAEIYAVVPDPSCQGLCTSYCGPVLASRQEMANARQAGVDLVEPARRMLQLSAVAVPIPMCPALVDGRCAVYGVRPLICRLWA